jgi:hypothetical protein
LIYLELATGAYMNRILTLLRGQNYLACRKVSFLRSTNIILLFLLLSAGQLCFAQVKADPKGIAAVKDCSGLDLQQQNYVVRSSRLDHPFAFLPWIQIKVRQAASEIAALVNDKPFRYETARDEALKIIEGIDFLPDTSDVRVQIRVEMLSVENCADGKVDLIYRIYSTQILPVLSSVPEARVTEKQTPQTTAGMTNVEAPDSSPMHLTPTAGYDADNKLYGGGRFEILQKQLWKLPFNSIVIEGKGSSSMRSISAALSGSKDSEKWLAHTDWRLNYSNYSLPTGAGTIAGGQLSAQVSSMTRPFQNGNFAARFGALLEGGNRQGFIADAALAPDTISSSGFGSLKLYAGLNSRFSHNVFSVSYGLGLGANGANARVDWRKHIGDLKHEFWYPIGEHRILDIESQFTIGGVQVKGKIPLAERFFGGNNEELFIPGESWQIRANPVIRAIPGSRLFRTADGAGGERFFSYNLTAAYALWRMPLMPTELRNDPEFKTLLQGSINSATSILQNYFAAKDEHYTSLATKIPLLQSTLADLKAAIIATQEARPGEFTAQFKACLSTLNTAIRRTKSAAESKQDKQYSFVQALLSVSEEEDENWLAKVMACVTNLNGSLHDTAIATISASLDRTRSAMEVEYKQIDQAKATRLAEADMTFTRRTLNTLFNDVNIYSVSPVFVLDVAKLASSEAGLGGVRYGPGVGVRLELASTVHFTVGYAWNIKQGPGEGSGSVFFALGIRDLFN